MGLSLKKIMTIIRKEATSVILQRGIQTKLEYLFKDFRYYIILVQYAC